MLPVGFRFKGDFGQRPKGEELPLERARQTGEAKRPPLHLYELLEVKSSLVIALGNSV